MRPFGRPRIGKAVPSLGILFPCNRYSVCQNVRPQFGHLPGAAAVECQAGDWHKRLLLGGTEVAL
jgi:hypothetical protein